MKQAVLLADEIELAYGKSLPQRSRVAGIYPVFGSNGQIDVHKEPLVEGPGIIVGRKGSIGEVIWTDEDFWPIDTTYFVKPKNYDDSLRYWYYQLKALGLNSLNSHSAIPGLNRDVVYAKQVIKRTPDIQKKIASILSSLDEKIELNRKMNETLEQMGQALFRHYFVDNLEAKGWRNGVIGDLFNVCSGFAFKGSDFNTEGKFGLVTIKNVQDGNFISECTDKISVLPKNMPEYANLSSGDILLSLTGNVGRVCIVTGKDMLLNQRVAKIEGKDGLNSYAYFMFRHPEFKNKLISISRGTAQLNLSPVETKDIKIKLPSDLALKEFSKSSGCLLNKIVVNIEEIQSLICLRDTLLPRLISGKIKV